MFDPEWIRLVLSMRVRFWFRIRPFSPSNDVVRTEECDGVQGLHAAKRSSTAAIMYILIPELTNPESVRSLKAGILYFTVDLVLRLCRLFGATGIRKIVWRVRSVGSD